MAKRKARKKIKTKEIDYLKPLNITDFGTDNDPCFGIHHDAKADECRRCGDSEICLIVMSQKMNAQRKTIEADKKYLDTEPVLPAEKDSQIQVPKLIKRYLKKGYKESKIKRLILKKYPKENTDKISRLIKRYGKSI